MSRTIYTIKSKPKSALERKKSARRYRLNSPTTRVKTQSLRVVVHKWLKRRCEAAAAKAGGSPPRVLARVLACCRRFFELLHPDGAARMERLRQAEALSSPPTQADAEADAGLGAMRAFQFQFQL